MDKLQTYVVLRRCSSLIRRVVATSRSKGVLPQSWVVGHSYIVARSTERTRTLNLGVYIHDTGRNISLIENPLLQPLLITGFKVSLCRASTLRDALTRRDAAAVDSLLWTQMTEFIWTHSWKVSEMKKIASCSYCLTLKTKKRMIVSWICAVYSVTVHKLCFFRLCSSLLVSDGSRLIYRLLLIKC